MKVCGIIAEYNPFHNGHAYHIEKTKEQTGADAIVAVMSGNFVQRGEPALLDKWRRARMALENGVDLVIELPTFYATASAEYFAQGAVGLLDSMGIIECLSFGAKTEDMDVLKRVANILYLEPEEYKRLLQNELKKGVSYPMARSSALKVFTRKEYDAKYITDILLDSNNILAIEYLKALMYNNSTIVPYMILRKGEDYNSTNVVEGICSSTAIRNMIENGQFEALPEVMPERSFEVLNQELLGGRHPMLFKNFEKEILYVLRTSSTEDLAKLTDVTEGLENLLKKFSNETCELDKLVALLKTKRYTRTRIQRILLHALLNVRKSDVDHYKYNPQYIRVLGFTSKGEKLLSQIYNQANIPIVTSVSKFLKTANDTASLMMKKDILASDIYMLGYQIPDYKKANMDYTEPIVQVK